MKQRITIALNLETHKWLKDKAKQRNVSVKKMGEEYFDMMAEKLIKENKL